MQVLLVGLPLLAARPHRTPPFYALFCRDVLTSVSGHKQPTQLLAALTPLSVIFKCSKKHIHAYLFIVATTLSNT